MDIYIDIVYRINNNFISGLFISILTILIFHLFFKERANRKLAIIIVRWIIIVYCSMALIYQVSMFIAPSSSEYRVWERASGPYWWAYWITIVSHSVLPLILILIKRRGSLWFLFSLSIMINLTWFIESFIIHMVNFHRDYMPQDADYSLFLPFPREQLIMFKGFVIGIIILIAVNARPLILIIKRKFQNV